MKKLHFLALTFLFTAFSFAQSNIINYKAIIKDNLGNTITNQSITVQFNIRETHSLGLIVYTETHTPTTDANGLIILNIGAGTTSDDFTDITWGDDNHFLNVKIDTAGGTTYTDMGTTQFMAVPYALHAQNVNGMAFKTENGVTSNTNITDDFVVGSPQLNDDGDTTHDNRMFFDKSKGAFRVGSTVGTEWDNTNIGSFSIAMGLETTASGNVSTALGVASIASGPATTAMGFVTTASGDYSTAIGRTTNASGESSTAIGHSTIASGDSSTAMGFSTNASGESSTAIGRQTTASGNSSTAMGNLTEAKSYAQTTIGLYNTNTETPNSTTGYNANDRLFVVGNGPDDTNRSNALVMLKSGNTQLNGLLTLDDNNGNGFTFPNVDGTANQVLETDGSGTLTWTNGAAESPFINTTNVISGGDTDDDFVFGSTQLGDVTGTTDDNRMLFDKSKGAFRAGTMTGDGWDDTNIGSNSVAMGFNTFASGDFSFAMGDATNATGTNSVAMGVGTTASGNNAIAVGVLTTASGAGSAAIGYSTTSSGDFSFAIGDFTIASGKSSNAMGHFIESKSHAQTTIGLYNTNTETPNSTNLYDAADRLFVIGNGPNNANRSDALVMLKNGNTQLNGLLTLDDNNGNGFTFPNVDGTANQVLETDGSGTLTWADGATESPFTNTTNVISGGDTDDDFVFGSTQLGNDGDSSHGRRMFFDKSKSAFRAGRVLGSEWDDANIGFNSVAFGFRSIASGTSSVAAGNNTTASGDSSTALGFYTIASGNSSTAMGSFTEAKSYGQTTIGINGTNTETPNSTDAYNATDRLFVIGNGSATNIRSDALVMLKNGNTQLNGLLTLDDNFGGGFTFPNIDGTANQVLETDGAGTLTWTNGAAESPFINTTNVISGGDTNDDFVFGSTQLDDDGDTTHDNRMFFDKSKGAFRAGIAEGTQWNNANIGNNSIAMGRSTIASGNYATAIGNTTIASGVESTSMGVGTTASGSNSTAMGILTTASASSSTAMGNTTTASGSASTAMGVFTTASGNISTAMGNNTEAKSYAQTTIGINSTNTETPNSTDAYNATDRLFVIGNGSATNNRSDALVLLKNGNTQLNGLLTLDDNNGNGFTFPNVDGSANQVLETDGAGTLTWTNGATESPFSKTGNVISGGDTGDDFVFGSTQLDDDESTTDDSSRMFFDKSKGAFRAGYMFTGLWDADSVGAYSIGLGINNIASGAISVAIGGSTRATGNSSLAMGSSTSAIGNFSTALGANTRSSSYGETAIGIYTTLTGAISSTTYNANDRLFVIGNGIDISNRSDAFVMLKNGNTQLNGQLTLDDNNGNGFTFPNVDGTANQVLETDGSGTLTWVDASFTNTTNVISGGDANDDFVFGSTQLDYVGTIDHSKRMFFDKSTGAFRAGSTDFNFWNSGNRGNYSAAMGYNTTASGSESFAMGDASVASGDTSTAMGKNTDAKSYAQTTIGMNNTFATPNSTTAYNANDRLFVIGNGTGVGNRSDALVVLKNGDATLAGTLTQNSDRRLKTDISTLQYGLDEILKLNPVAYHWKKYPEQTKKSIGLIAQEVQLIINEIIKVGDDKDKTLSLSYIELIPVLIKAMQEQQDIIESQQIEIKSLTSELAETNENQTLFNTKLKQLEALEARLSALENNASKKSNANELLTAQNNN